MEIKPNHKIKACKQNWLVKINLQGDERCLIAVTLHKQMKFSIKGFFSKCDQSTGNCGSGHIYWRNSWMENYIFCAVLVNEKILLRGAFRIFPNIYNWALSENS